MSAVAFVEPIMANKDKPGSSEPPAVFTTTVRVLNDLVEMARVVCAHSKDKNGKHLKMTDYINSILRGPVQKDYEQVLRKIRNQ